MLAILDLKLTLTQYRTLHPEALAPMTLALRMETPGSV
jgi:hypothetical protein